MEGNGEDAREEVSREEEFSATHFKSDICKTHMQLSAGSSGESSGLERYESHIFKCLVE